MGERPDQIERQIAETRSELSDNFSELQRQSEVRCGLAHYQFENTLELFWPLLSAEA